MTPKFPKLMKFGSWSYWSNPMAVNYVPFLGGNTNLIFLCHFSINFFGTQCLLIIIDLRSNQFIGAIMDDVRGD